jgi:hypothetical protein
MEPIASRLEVSESIIPVADMAHFSRSVMTKGFVVILHYTSRSGAIVSHRMHV